MKTEGFIATLEDVLRVPRGTLKLEDGPNTIDAWDSIASVTILATIDQELHFDLSDKLLLQSNTVGQIIDTLKSRGLLQD